MDGFQAFKYYLSIKLHFTNPKFNVFVNRGRIKGSIQTFTSRNDRYLFEKVARQYPADKDCIRYFASNFMYGNPNVVYNDAEATANYKEYIRRKQSITRVFVNDLDVIAHQNSGRHRGLDVLQLLLGRKITLETAVILNDMDGFVDKMKQSPLALVMGDDLLRIEKSKGFVKYDPCKVMGPYQQFLEEIKGTANG